ncbi:TRAM domain-containing protein [Halopenitus persicus]|uniref:Predicted RNA-binding protein, contains TRAM domain n=1 Tax=Halopenitus persicus TaxID=1048396 RepID=A0A1H3LGE6_9EURY|nr:TRAM domain-containing protein [Halopenitus persicus]SDY63219.1 Predicted RNA-binding protein, contains TRAM domain [Halopenitus persicus]
MTEIPDSLRLLYETTLEKRDGQYTISIPKEIVDGSSLTTDDVYRVALLASAKEAQDEAASSERATNDNDSNRNGNDTPPVEEGEVRSVTIDTLGDQGDGIAKVERGFIVIVPGTQPGDIADVKITDVKNSVAFAEPVADPEVRC